MVEISAMNDATQSVRIRSKAHDVLGFLCRELCSVLSMASAVQGWRNVLLSLNYTATFPDSTNDEIYSHFGSRTAGACRMKLR